MALPLSDDEAGRQILGIFVRHRVPANGTLKRIHFFDVRDSDFQRGINSAVAKRWITVHHRDRYCYILTDDGYAAGRQSEAAAARAAGCAAVPRGTACPMNGLFLRPGAFRPGRGEQP
jgi:hypothetical protein